MSFSSYINSRVQLSPQEMEIAEEACDSSIIKKGELLIKEGQVAHRMYFIQSGCARTYYYHQDKEVTSWIYREEQLATAWSSFYTRSPSFEELQALETLHVTSISHEKLQDLFNRNSKFQHFGRLICQEQLVFLDSFFKGQVFMNAKEKLDVLINYFPDITQRVNLGYIASLLGITQETLSRIRRK